MPKSRVFRKSIKFAGKSRLGGRGDQAAITVYERAPDPGAAQLAPKRWEVGVYPFTEADRIVRDIMAWLDAHFPRPSEENPWSEPLTPRDLAALRRDLDLTRPDGKEPAPPAV